MEILLNEKNDITIIDVKGPVDLYHSGKLKDAIEKKISEGGRKFIINLEKVEYIDSSGIGSLISSMQNLKKVSGSLALLKLTEPVEKVFKLTRLDGFFKIYKSEEEAVSAMG
ncbi:MAG TPA: STAS domain-containing protein [Spirochaetota bacterium]|nr:STAS domain-containing protein [Spirochaetota bacterium]